MRRRRELEPERVWISEAVLEQILAAAKERAPRETGGMLVGYLGVEPAELVVTGTIEGGPRAIEKKEGFEPNGAWQREELARRYEESGRVTTFVGDWHSHPAGVAAPSRKDLRTARRVSRARAARMKEPLTLIAACDENEKWVIAGYRYRRWRLRAVPLELF